MLIYLRNIYFILPFYGHILNVGLELINSGCKMRNLTLPSAEIIQPRIRDVIVMIVNSNQSLYSELLGK